MTSLVGMRMKDPIPTFSHLVSRVKELHPDLAYIHVVETRVDGAADAAAEDIKEFETNDFIRKIWAPKPLISAGGYTRESGIETADGERRSYCLWSLVYFQRRCFFPLLRTTALFYFFSLTSLRD